MKYPCAKKWNNSNDPIWGCIFCYNINFNMNYWLAQSANLAECHKAAIDFIDSLRESGRKSAKAYFNARGWFASKKSDIWGFTKPYASGMFGYFISGSAWLCADVWMYYHYTQDEEYLKNKALPILEEAVLFYLDFFTENEQGEYVANPSASPENSFLYEGQSCWLTEGTEINHRIIQELLENYLKACEILNHTGEIKEEAERVLPRIAGPRFTNDGAIREWDKDFEESEPEHRHISPVYGLYPGRIFTKEKTPEVVAAIEKMLLRRGRGSTGWSRAWKMAAWARMKNSEMTSEMLQGFLRNVIYSNLFCTHPPFQIDGNFGYTAAIIEMLVRGDENGIRLLPAIPDVWEEGVAKGICVRGGYEIDFAWKDKKVIWVELRNRKKKDSVSAFINGKEQILKSGEKTVIM